MLPCTSLYKKLRKTQIFQQVLGYILVYPLTSTMKVVQRIQQNSWFWTNYLTIHLTLWNRWAAFAASKFPRLTIDGNADSRGTSAVFQSVTLFYAVCSIFPSTSSCFWPNSHFFATGNGIWQPFCHFCHFVEFMLKKVFLVSKLVCFVISSDAILPE
jgi:hypothetical protein